MTLVVNLVRTVFSAKFICCCWRNPCCDFLVTHTSKCNEPARIQANYCGSTIVIVFLFSQCCLRITTQLSSGAVDKMAGIFTKRIWQPCICQPNDLKIKKKTGGPKGGAKGGAKQKSGGPWPTQAPLRIATDNKHQYLAFLFKLCVVSKLANSHTVIMAKISKVSLVMWHVNQFTLTLAQKCNDCFKALILDPNWYCNSA